LVRPIALNRKNAIVTGHDEGGRTLGRIASLIETAKINGVEPFAYLKLPSMPSPPDIQKTASTTCSGGTSSRQTEILVLPTHGLHFISEATVYRVLKFHDLITSPAFIVIKAANKFRDKTSGINQRRQTDFTYIKVLGWG
jgi:hypothetical protein